MERTALDDFADRVAGAWGPISSELVDTCRSALAKLTCADAAELWLASLRQEKPASRELLRSPTQGFMLLAHTENQGLFRPPHDHGRGWVVYAVQSGALEIRTYGKVARPDGTLELVLRDETILEPGTALAYLPGDIHDTRCLSPTALLFRFTERDLRHEDQVERKVTRFVERDGRWVAPQPCE
ncbi:hypothetical protein H8M03_11560 [Sphingomonas sabuli]|uniref:Cysteine dioxygenase n=1 Tax=Sphingomonas sabuli TaxID=2764186 RepID=A0A7G9L1W9_9SPHN|nr:hypothetical protein [Sphingomonas sabuli]QNM82618.1 hypothetical protein H8M03_11560 [Sphingomonas sabuli]